MDANELRAMVGQGPTIVMSSKEDMLKLLDEHARMKEALRRVATWHGEFPVSGQFFASGEPMPYGFCFGSNGERDYMRGVAREGLGE